MNANRNKRSTISRAPRVTGDWGLRAIWTDRQMQSSGEVEAEDLCRDVTLIMKSSPSIGIAVVKPTATAYTHIYS